jgi:hypothetical protein
LAPPLSDDPLDVLLPPSELEPEPESGLLGFLAVDPLSVDDSLLVSLFSLFADFAEP